ncbi:MULTISPECIES: DNA internalization-related competence protein ComEC/Rec2 [Amylolactobacillus]|uniref:DNA internalization-related competence protein ComEC/Rec2 n=1 Tax=Amylolactobacillus amylophilus DSM 20533 = JCM 1125 TaxID=1423721 RepID=A0A1L6XDV3_9LACO|nr:MULTISPECIES: DNA internalization-related competence protein ComEC/Rec2 [Amylolactobacillus]APT19135.1 DNA internalization-related competence protein ComEC/Rec2 [Amylolactobacillus amylophilus DSM 20533 = JCM 1125]GED79623.1 DNA internalization-related competence protein ComEC/Rec2 [Amylolactobacillus amylophilus]
MKVLPIKSPFDVTNLFSSGKFFVLAGLSLLSVLTFLNKNTLASFLLLLVLLSYFLLMVLNKRQLDLLILLPLIVLLLGYFQDKKFEALAAPNQRSPIYVIRPDKVTLKDDFFYGEATSAEQTVTLQLKPTPQMRRMVAAGLPFLVKINQFKAELITEATNIGEFNLREFYKRKRIKYALTLTKYLIAKKQVTLSDRIIQFRARLRQWLSQLPENLRFFSGELFLGENLGTGEHNLVDDFRNIGIIHLLSLSGMHVLLYTQVVTFLFNLCKINQRVKYASLVLLLLVVCIIGDFQAGLVRASLAYVVSILAKLSKKRIGTLDQFGIVALIHQLLMPQLFLNVGAQLSYLMVLGLKIMPRMGSVGQSARLNMLITPILLFNFFELNILTIFYNFLAIPLFNFIILPVTVGVVICGALMPGLIPPAEQILSILSGGVSFLGRVGLGNVVFGQLAQVITFSVTFLLISWLIFWSEQAKRRFCLYTGLILLALNILLNLFPINGQVTFIDVGQGDSILLTTPINRKTVLIDTGGRLNFGGTKPRRSNFEKVSLPFLKSQGITHIDAVFLSHQDADHIGDLADLLENFTVNKLYFGIGMQANPSFQRKIRPFLKQVKLIPVQAGDQLLIGTITIDVLHPSIAGLGTNEDSVALKVSIGRKKWLFTGDLDIAGEQKIIRQTADIQADFLKLGHHGSKTSTDESFLLAVNPRVAFISAGRNNRYHHPHQETLDKLQTYDIRSLNTAECGMINWYFNPFGLNWLNYYLK